MSCLRYGIVLVLSLALVVLSANAQGTYPMSNATITDCYGNFTDSEANMVNPGWYGHNENYTFTIAVPAADDITMIFSAFQTELGLDVIRFFDGPDTLSPQIGGDYSGSTLPPTITATSGYLTIHFISDASVASDGWLAQWTANITMPDPPVFDPITNPPCSTTVLTLTLDQEVQCDSLDPGDFSIFGPIGQTVTSVTPIGCTGGGTNTFDITIAPGLNISGPYNIVLTTWFLDDCDSLWELTSFGNFEVTDCPIYVEIEASDTTICEGQCTDIIANVWGGDPATYNYTWSPALPATAGPHSVCPLTNTTYNVTVTDGGPSPAGTASLTITVNPLATMPASFTTCRTDPPTNLSATPTGGWWYGDGITDGTLGTFNPAAAGPGVKTVYYWVNGCENSMTITVTNVTAGSSRAACPGSAPFNLSGIPAGGTWSGTGITDPVAGTFDPTVAGIGAHTITYTTPGCPPATTTVNVDNIWVQADTTICSNSEQLDLSFSPLGGYWTGPGIVNSFWGVFDPDDAGIGTHTLTYTMNGCSQTVDVTVTDIFAGWNITACPDEPPFALTGASPAGGIWSGDGIVDPVAGIFDPASWGGSNYNAWVYYTLSGCTDTMRVYNIRTRVNIDPLPSTCPGDTIMILNYANTQRNPWTGSWSGPGVLPAGSNGRFDPGIAGSGTHTLIYTDNGCIDSAHITVYADPNLRDTIVCEAQSPFNIPNDAPGGFWVGPGIVNPVVGTFSAATAGVGTHLIGYATPAGCTDTMTVTVTAMPTVNITGLALDYCFADSTVVLNGTPAGGTWTGPLVSPGTFNPINAGAGFHTIKYTVGTGDCAVTRTVNTTVSPPLQINTNFTDTIICFDDLIRISASASGGRGLSYDFTWDNGLGLGTSHLVGPSTSRTYNVVVSDGCSQPASANITINVEPEISLDFETSPIGCWEDDGWVKAYISPGGSYTFVWDGDSLNTDSIYRPSGHYYDLTVYSNASGCQTDASIQIPAWDEVIAQFITAPNDNCADLINPQVQFIDQSQGGNTGYWVFGEGGAVDYTPGVNPYYTYRDTGTYTALLHVENEGGCSDNFLLDVCVVPGSLVHIPNAFSPNGDGSNDVFKVHAVGANDFLLSIYNRWGQLLFETNDPDQGWDGYFGGELVQMGGYPYVISYRSAEDGQVFQRHGIITVIR